jgi:uncharacterized surface protein with fasciclin (FAS1) repeats
MQIKTVSMLVALLLLSAVPLNVAADENDDIPTNAMSTGVHDSLVAALAHADLVTTLQGDGPFTVFAPTDQAFIDAEIDLSTFDTDEENATLENILLYHVYSGAVNAADVTDGLTVTMVNGAEASFTVTDGTVMVGDATVTTADVDSSNGIIHVIDKVLMPPADETPQGEICYNMVSHTIVPGSTALECESYMYLEDYEMNGQNVTGCYNSETHQVSNVSQAICEGYMWTPAVDIAMTAMATGMHSSLVAALAKADLVTTLQGDGPFTVFAPTDQAFIDAEIDLDSFTTDEDIAALADILLFHVYSGAVNAADVTDGLTVSMVNGDEASFTVTADAVMVGDATVVLADVPASNGVIHVIDKVLMPPADEVVDLPDETTCDVTIGISSDGNAFSPASVTVQVNQTVCWQWTDSEMAHNVKEVDGMKSTTFVTDGITSGAPEVTVDFSYTFTEDTVFYYACEPHISLDMFGKVTVGDGGIVAPADDDDKEEENTPGFLGVTMILATLGAVLYSRSNRDEKQ